MSMPMDLERMEADDRPMLERLFQLYLHDMSEFLPLPIAEDGTFPIAAELLPPYWERADHLPYLIRHDGEIAGFSLVRRAPDSDEVWDMGQFGVLRKFRGTGLAREAFHRTLIKHPGRWQVRVLPKNTVAYRFWTSAINAVACDEVDEAIVDYKGTNMICLSFRTSQ